ncbi:MAG: tetratricopeptide repeat protein [Elusimicrobiales bacterium]|nr:tetratricopeptide repeat protein [Elusimicrobiales bacterium]
MEKIEKLLDAGEFSKALAALKKVSPGSGRARWLFLKGEALRGLGLFAAALKEYAAARKAALSDEDLLLETLLSEARCSRALGDEKCALASAKAALSLSKKLDSFAEEAELEWALALRLVGRLPEAAKSLEGLLKGYRKAGDHPGAAFVLWALGGLYRLQGRYADGINAFEDSLKAANRGKDEAAAGYALFGLGGILRVAGFMGRSLDCYVRARKLFSGTDDAFAKAYAECGTANVLRQLGRLDEAYAGYERAHKLYSALSDWADLGFVEWGMGEINKKNGHFSDALKNYSRAAALFKGRSEPRGEALTLLSLANLYYLTGDTARAERQHAAAMKHIRKHNLHTHLETFT